MTDDILFRQEKHIGVITLNRPKALNALTLPMILAMQEQLLAWKENPNVHAVLIQAAEGRAFCAGGDVRWLYERGLEKDARQMDFFWHEYQLNHFISTLGKPYIALMNGITMGGGVGVSLHGSHAVATEQFSFAMPETGIGFFPDIGASYLLSRCPDAFGTYLALSGGRLNAKEAQAVGLIRFVMQSADLVKIYNELLSLDLSSQPFEQVDELLKAYNQRQEADQLNQLNEQRAITKAVFSADDVPTIFSRLKNTKQGWCQKVHDTLQTKAPLSLCVTLKQIQKARTMSLAECLEMDMAIVSHFMRGHDFYEGVRALLVDKDKQPKWQPQTLEEVSESLVDEYFKPYERGLHL